MKYIPIKNGKGEITGFTVSGENYTLKNPMIEKEFKAKIGHISVVDLSDNSIFAFKRGGGTSSTSPSALLTYIFTNNNLFQGTEQTTPAGAKGYTTSTAETPLLDFYKIFAYNETNYNLIVGSPNVEVSFLCSDRRSGVAGSRRAWSPYFKLSDLEKPTFTLIQNALTGTDQTANYNIQGKITRNANGDLFITVIDTHSGNNLYGSIINIRHRVV